MVGLVSDSLDSDEEDTRLKSGATTNPADYTVPDISELDFNSPLFDSLSDFDELKDFWKQDSPSGKGDFLGVEEVMDMVGNGSGVGNEKDAILDVAGTDGGGVVKVEKEGVEELRKLGSDDVDMGNLMSMEKEELRSISGLNPGAVDAEKSEVSGDGAVGDLMNEVKVKSDGSESLSPTIEVDLRNFSLDGPGDGSGNVVSVKTVEEGGESESQSDRDDESSLPQAASSTSSSSDDDDDRDGVDGEGKGILRRNAEKAGLIEEGEIMEEDAEQMVAWSDDEDAVLGGPIRSKNELTELPPVPKVEVTLQPNHQTVPVGVVLSIVEKQVIVEGVEKHNPLDVGSILWITESREPMGLVDDIFGPVKNPYYMIRYNSDDEVPSGISVGTPISLVPEFAKHVLNDGSLYRKGYDASNENDEELSEEIEFSDDEKEAEYRRMQKMSKRGSNEEAGGKRKKDRRKNRNQDGNWNNTQLPSPQPSFNGGELPATASNNSQQHPSAETACNQRNHSSGEGQAFPEMASPFQHVSNSNGFNPGANGVWQNGMPVQQPMFFPGAFPPNSMLWMQQQNPFNMPMPMPQGMLFMQQFGGPNQMLPPNLMPGGQPMFMGGPSNSPFPGFFGQNNFNQGNKLQFMANARPRTPLNNSTSSEQNGTMQPPPNLQGNANNAHQQPGPDMSPGRGGNFKSQWRGRSGGRGGRFNNVRGFGGKGRGRH